jgi:hypothetical protein
MQVLWRLEGRVPEDWKAKPAKLRHKDRDARWMVKFSKAKAKHDGTVPPVDIAIPVFGYKNHVSIDRNLSRLEVRNNEDRRQSSPTRRRHEFSDISRNDAVTDAFADHLDLVQERAGAEGRRSPGRIAAADCTISR